MTVRSSAQVVATCQLMVLLQLLLLLSGYCQLLLLLSVHCQLLLLPAVPASCSCQLPAVPASCSCQLFLSAAAAAAGVAAAPAAVWPLLAAADWPYSIKMEETSLKWTGLTTLSCRV